MADSSPERSLRITGQPTGRVFVARQLLAVIGLWIAVLTPTSVTLAPRIAALDPENKASSLALVAGVSAIFALVSNPIAGRLSDRCTSRWGRRRPFMVGGIVVGTVALFVMGTAPSIPVVLLGWCLTQVALNAGLSALIAVLPDRIPEHCRGRVSGLMGMTNQVGPVIGTFLIQFTGTTGAAMFVVPALIGPQSVAPAIAPLFLAIGGGGGNYTALYLAAGGFAILGGIVVQFIRGAR